MLLDREELKEKLIELKLEHRDLDEAIEQMGANVADTDILKLQRMKKRKLALKDMIQKIESILLDDIVA